MEKEKKAIYKKWWFWLLIILLLFILGSNTNTTDNYNNSVNNNTTTNNINNNIENTTSNNNIENTNTDIEKNNNTDIEEKNIPSDIELMSYAQLVLEDNLNNPTYSRSTSDYTFISTGLRCKIEGNVTINSISNKFYMIIEFIDNTYKEYDLISLQVGNETIYKK